MPFEIDAKRLLRKPLSAAKLPLYVNEVPRAFPSPDGTVAVVCSHDFEPSMCANCFLFSLVAPDGSIVNTFEPVLGEGKRNNCVWSSDAALFAITINGKQRAIFVYDVKQRTFKIIPIANTYQFAISFANQVRLRVTFDEDQVPKETKFVLGMPGGRKPSSVADFVLVPYHAPSRKYRAPDSVLIHLDAIRSFAWSNYVQGREYFSRFKPIPFSPIFEGFYPYRGPFPASTKGLMVGRMIDFADYGDEQAKVWVALLRQRMGNRFSQWEPANHYLGVLQRTIAPPTQG